LGGRAAEEVIFGKISTGALSDLEKVTKQAHAMVTFYGLSKKIGNVSFYDSTGAQEYAFNKPFSEKTSEIIDSEISELVESAYKRAVDILKKNKAGLEKLAGMLLEKEVIFGEDLEGIFGVRPWKKEERIASNAVLKAEEELKKVLESQDKNTDAEAKVKESNTSPENAKESNALKNESEVSDKA
jgi:hypothetical protein